MTNDIIKNLINSICKVSMCEPQIETNLNEIDNIFKVYNKEKFIIEFGSENPIITVHEGQDIMIDDTIAIMDDVPVKSKVCGTILEINEKYIVGKYINDIDKLLSIYNLSSESSNDDITKQFNIDVK